MTSELDIFASDNEFIEDERVDVTLDNLYKREDYRIIKIWTSAQYEMNIMRTTTKYLSENNLKITSVVRKQHQNNSLFVELKLDEALLKFFTECLNERQGNTKLSDKKEKNVLDYCGGKFKIVIEGRIFTLMLIEDVNLIWVKKTQQNDRKIADKLKSMIIEPFKSILTSNELFLNILNVLLLNKKDVEQFTCIQVKKTSENRLQVLIVYHEEAQITHILNTKFNSKESDIYPSILHKKIISSLEISKDEMFFNESKIVAKSDLLKNIGSEKKALRKIEKNLALLEELKVKRINVQSIHTVNINNFCNHKDNKATLTKRSIFERLGDRIQENEHTSSQLNEEVSKKRSRVVELDCDKKNLIVRIMTDSEENIK